MICDTYRSAQQAVAHARRIILEEKPDADLDRSVGAQGTGDGRVALVLHSSLGSASDLGSIAARIVRELAEIAC